MALAVLERPPSGSKTATVLELDGPPREGSPALGSAGETEGPLARWDDRVEEESMSDLIFLLLSVVLFYLAIRYTRWADRV